VEIEITKAELEEKFFSVRLTIVDTPGFGDYVNSNEAWAPIVEFLDDQVSPYSINTDNSTNPTCVRNSSLNVKTRLTFEFMPVSTLSVPQAIPSVLSTSKS